MATAAIAGTCYQSYLSAESADPCLCVLRENYDVIADPPSRRPIRLSVSPGFALAFQSVRSVISTCGSLQQLLGRGSLVRYSGKDTMGGQGCVTRRGINCSRSIVVMLVIATY